MQLPDTHTPSFPSGVNRNMGIWGPENDVSLFTSGFGEGRSYSAAGDRKICPANPLQAQQMQEARRGCGAENHVQRQSPLAWHCLSDFGSTAESPQRLLGKERNEPIDFFVSGTQESTYQFTSDSSVTCQSAYTPNQAWCLHQLCMSLAFIHVHWSSLSCTQLWCACNLGFGWEKLRAA